jgi:hypothetical protein
MKHDLEGFSRDIVRLIKMSGDTGGSGDNSKKCPRHSGFFVPTRQAAVSPEWEDPVRRNDAVYLCFEGNPRLP